MDACPTGDQEVVGSTPASSATFVEIDHEIFSMVILLPSADSRRVVVSFWQKNVHNIGLLHRGLSMPCKSVVR